MNLGQHIERCISDIDIIITKEMVNLDDDIFMPDNSNNDWS